MMKKKLNTRYYLIIFVSIGALVFIYSSVRDYWVYTCQNKYDFSYNFKRQALGIPLIPNNWYIKERDKDFIWWANKQNSIGHSWKTVAFSGCDIKGELDSYSLPIQNGKRRWLTIRYKYEVKSQKDSIVYNYQIEHSTKDISKNVADSIFKAENINKDY